MTEDQAAAAWTQLTTATTEPAAIADPPEGGTPAAPPETSPAEPAPPVPAVATADPAPDPAPREQSAPAAMSEADRLRAEYAEIANVAAQAARLGVTVDAADAMKRGVAPEALRRSVLDALAARAEASAVVSAAPQPAGAAPAASPIVKRARERAAATQS